MRRRWEARALCVRIIASEEGRSTIARWLVDSSLAVACPLQSLRVPPVPPRVRSSTTGLKAPVREIHDFLGALPWIDGRDVVLRVLAEMPSCQPPFQTITSSEAQPLRLRGACRTDEWTSDVESVARNRHLESQDTSFTLVCVYAWPHNRVPENSRQAPSLLAIAQLDITRKQTLTQTPSPFPRQQPYRRPHAHNTKLPDSSSRSRPRQCTAHAATRWPC